MDGGKKKTDMDQAAKARIMSSEAKKNDGQVDKGTFGTRAQSAADKHEAEKNA